MLRIFKKKQKQRGLPPGTPVYVGEERTGPVRISILDYDEAHFEEKEAASVEDCFPFKDKPTVTWVNFDGIHQPELIERIGREFGLHPLILEDIVHTTQRPKLEDHGKYLYMVLKMLSRGEGQEDVDAEQISLVLGPTFVLSFQEKPGDVFGPLRERIRTAKGRVRSAGADYLAYSLLDAVVDNYFQILEGVSDRIESLEDVVVSRPEPAVLGTIHHMKKEMIFLRKSLWPLREAISALSRGESQLVEPATQVYLRDVYDHTIQIIEVLEAYRDVISGMVDTYLSSVSNRMNEVMKVLTIIATIFIPMTFIAGIYGMNFDAEASPLNMPELKWQWGYPAAWVVMLGVAAAMLFYFRRKKWI